MRRLAAEFGHSYCVAYQESYLAFAKEYLDALERKAREARRVLVITADNGTTGKTQKEEMEEMRQRNIKYDVMRLDQYEQEYRRVPGTSPPQDPVFQPDDQQRLLNNEESGKFREIFKFGRFACGAITALGGGGDTTFECMDPSGAPVQVTMPSTVDLKGVNQMYFKQKMTFCSCCETKYDVFTGWIFGSRTFFAEEKTTGCCRWLFPKCAPIEVDIGYVGGYLWGPDTVFKLKKECTCCCTAIGMFDKESNKIGSIREPCCRCPGSVAFDVLDHNDMVLLKTEQNRCSQWGLCCPFPFGPCKSAKFSIKDLNGKEVGVLTKRIKGPLTMWLCSWCFNDVPDSDFAVEFPGIIDPRSKLLVMGLAIFTDFRYFSNTGEFGAKS